MWEDVRGYEAKVNNGRTTRGKKTKKKTKENLYLQHRGCSKKKWTNFGKLEATGETGVNGSSESRHWEVKEI